MYLKDLKLLILTVLIYVLLTLPMVLLQNTTGTMARKKR